MEQNQPFNEPLFGLTVDADARNFLGSAAGWAKFLGIVGFILTGLTVLSAFTMGAVFNSVSSMDMYSDPALGAMGMFPTTVFVVIMLVFAALYFIMSLFLYKFGAKTKAALATEEQLSFNEGLKNLKNLFTLWGILTVIVLVFYTLIFLFSFLGAAMG